MPKDGNPGRTTIYNDDLGFAICARVANAESVRSICRDPTMPALQTIFRWLREKEDFAKSYAIAKEECAEAMVEDIMEIADDLAGDVQRDKLRVDARKWVAGKLKRKYSDRVHNEISGIDGENIKTDNKFIIEIVKSK